MCFCYFSFRNRCKHYNHEIISNIYWLEWAYLFKNRGWKPNEDCIRAKLFPIERKYCLNFRDRLLASPASLGRLKRNKAIYLQSRIIDKLEETNSIFFPLFFSLIKHGKPPWVFFICFPNFYLSFLIKFWFPVSINVVQSLSLKRATTVQTVQLNLFELL